MNSELWTLIQIPSAGYSASSRKLEECLDKAGEHTVET